MNKILNSQIPIIVKRKIIQITKPKGLKQYLLTLPKDFAQNLVEKNILSLIVIFNYGLAVFPNEGKKSEICLLEFLSAHPKLKQFFLKPTKHPRGL